MSDRLIDEFGIPSRDPKPREYGADGITEVIASTPLSETLLRRFGEYVDLVKLSAPNMYLTREQATADVELYHDHDVEVTFSSPPATVAAATDREAEYVALMEDLGVDWIEYEPPENASVEEIAATVDDMHDRGFRVIVEVGEKWHWNDATRLAKDVIDVERTIETFDRLLEAGVDKVDWEGMIVRNLLGRHLDNYEGQQDLLRVVRAVGYENVTFEAYGPESTGAERARYFCWLVHHFGPDINIANIPPSYVPHVERIRSGIHYEMDHPYLRWLEQGEPTDEYWEMPMPPYETLLRRD